MLTTETTTDTTAEPPGGKFWAWPLPSFLATIDTTPSGLSEVDAAARLKRDGPNLIGGIRRHRALRLLAAQFASPVIVILVVATAVSMLLGDLTDGSIILAIVVASGLLGFWQEHSAGRAVDALTSKVPINAQVRRDGAERTIPVDALVVGDVVVLGAGDVVPADCRVLRAQRLQVDESALSGEAFPVEKTADFPDNAVFLGTHVVSGSATVVVARWGQDTEYAEVVLRLADSDVITSFERGMTRFGLLLVRAMVVLVTLIFLANLILGRPAVDSVLFSLALAVGLTPQLLPAIVAVSLSAGAKRMAARRVIVRRLDAIEDFGGMTVLCTDKTGTLTVGAVTLDRALDLDGADSPEVLRLARLNAGLQRSFANPIDAAILNGAARPDPAQRLDEVGYDFQRRRLSVLVADQGTTRLITKGAVANVLEVCRFAGTPDVRTAVDERYRTLSAQGFRVLGLAVKDMPGATGASAGDETGMTFAGLLAFYDPPKAGAAQAIHDLAGLGISVRLVTGDNRLAAARTSGCDPNRSPARSWTASATTSSPHGSATSPSSPRSSRCTRSASCVPCVAAGTRSGSSATASTTARPCTPPTSASRSTPPSRWPSRRPRSCCWTRTSA